MEGKRRLIFTEEEKERLRSLVVENKEIVESKKSGALSVIEKKKCWERIAEEFNFSKKYPERTVMQLRKAWDNIKTRRKAMLAAERRGRLVTGGEHTPDSPPEYDLYTMGLDVEIRDTIDSDSQRTKYVSTEDRKSAAPIGVRNRTEEPAGLAMQTDSSAPKQRWVDRHGEMLIRHEDELHKLNIMEAKLRIRQLRREMAQSEQLFKIKRKNLLLQRKKKV